MSRLDLTPVSVSAPCSAPKTVPSASAHTVSSGRTPSFAAHASTPCRWAIEEPLNFPRVAYGVDRPLPGGTNMPEITRRLADSLQRHRRDRIMETVTPD